jgi:hypothetical protein
MQGRQAGLKIEGMMQGIPAGDQYNPMRQMLKEAFEVAQFKTKGGQEAAPLNFSYTQYGTCMQTVIGQIQVPKWATRVCQSPFSAFFGYVFSS